MTMPTYHALADIGGTKLSVCLVRACDSPVSQSTQLLAKQLEPTVQTGASDAVPLQITRLVDAACAALGAVRDQVVSLNVATCGLFLKGELVAPNLCGGLSESHISDSRRNNWTSIPLAQTLRSAFNHAGCDVRIENDGVAALLAELRWGALHGSNNAAYVTWSTGIGVGLYVDGRVLRGKNGNAGHAGHMVVSVQQRPRVAPGFGFRASRILSAGRCSNVGRCRLPTRMRSPQHLTLVGWPFDRLPPRRSCAMALPLASSRYRHPTRGRCRTSKSCRCSRNSSAGTARTIPTTSRCLSTCRWT